MLSTAGNGDLSAVLASLYGPKTVGELLPVALEEEELSLTGYVAKPTLLKSSRLWQTFLVNGRVVASRLIAKALDNAYHSLLPRTGFPLAVLNIVLPPGAVDVNVHPQKSEIKFSDENKIFRAVYRAVSAALAGARPEEAAATWTPAERPRLAYRPSAGESPAQPPPAWREEPLPFAAALGTIRRERDLPGLDPVQPPKQPENSAPSLVALGQISDCYIVARGEDGLYIIDQHAAHERILYERLSADSGRMPVQTLLVPVYLDLDPQEAALVDKHRDIFAALGFTVEQVGPRTFRLTELPADIPPAESRAFVQDILALALATPDPTAAGLRHAFLQTAACRAAVKAGDPLTMRQIQALLQELAATALPYTCPHGRPAIVRFAATDLARLFKRT